MKKKMMVAGLAVVGMLLVATPSHAASINLGQWYSFDFGAPGTWGSNPQASPDSNLDPWTFTGPGIITVVDEFLRGDQFAAYTGGGSFIGLTSFPGSPSVGGNPFCATPDDCLADPSYSHGSFEALGGGVNSFKLLTIQAPPFDDVRGGAAAFRVDPVPEPASLFLFGTGALGLVARLRRRRQQ